MASMAKPAQRFVTFINQQLEILKEERNTLKEAVDDCINQVQSEVDAWVNGGLINQATCAEIGNKIQQFITSLIDKSVEFSVLQNIENNETSLTTIYNSVAKPSNRVEESKQSAMPSRAEAIHDTAGISEDVSSAHSISMRLAKVEEAVLSLQKTTVQFQEKQEVADTICKALSTQQENVRKANEILKNANLKSKRQLKIKLAEIEKTSQDISSNFENLYETVANVDAKLNILEEENKSVNVSMNEINEQISSVRTRSNEALESIQGLSKSVESTNQNYNEMSHKMNQLGISINLMSSQYTEHFDEICSFTNHKVDYLERAVDNRVAEISYKVAKLDIKCSLPNIRFYARTSFSATEDWSDVKLFDSVEVNNGDHFDPSTGIFTAPKNGLYLISISTESLGNDDKFGTRCYQKSNTQLHQVDDVHHLCQAFANQTIAQCTEMASGDIIFLKSTRFQEDAKNCLFIYFSCCMIKC